jgi:hypothetical protein
VQDRRLCDSDRKLDIDNFQVKNPPPFFSGSIVDYGGTSEFVYKYSKIMAESSEGMLAKNMSAVCFHAIIGPPPPLPPAHCRL